MLTYGTGGIHPPQNASVATHLVLRVSDEGLRARHQRNLPKVQSRTHKFPIPEGSNQVLGYLKLNSLGEGSAFRKRIENYDGKLHPGALQGPIQGRVISVPADEYLGD